MRWSLLLVLALVASALLLVHTAYESRRLFTEIERARSQHRQLERDHQRLEAERRAQATHLRIERMARERLAMRAATPALVHVVADPTAPAGPAAAGGGRP
jgi:cell division protein FtsL